MAREAGCETRTRGGGQVKLTIVFEAPEEDIKKAIAAIPMLIVTSHPKNPIVMLAIAMLQAYEEAKRQEANKKVSSEFQTQI